VPCHCPSVVLKVRCVVAHSGCQSPGQPSSDCRSPATVTEPTAGFGSAVVTVTGVLLTSTVPGSRRIAR